MSVDPTPWVPGESDERPPEVIFDLFRELPRQGPGCDSSTLKAWSLLQNLPPVPRVLNIGCGTGADALAIAREYDVRTTCIDIDVPSLETLGQRASNEGLTERIEPVECSLFDLSRFDNRSFNVLWAEGSIFILGFEKALDQWPRLLAPGGYLVISDLVWFGDERPAEAVEFWKRGYPDLQSIDERIAAISRQQVELTSHFRLPDECWWAPFYTPLEQRIPQLREKYRHDQAALDELDEAQTEVDIFRKYGATFGYEFFVMRVR